ncbi:hypothetical protein OKW40_003723 [Paraburkholderia sp. RAU6.4a]
MPSHVAPTVFTTMRRSESVLAMNGSRIAAPMSKPSVSAKTISSTPINTHQISLRTA